MTKKEQLIVEYNRLENKIENSASAEVWTLAYWLAENVPNPGRGRKPNDGAQAITIQDIAAEGRRSVSWLNTMRKVALAFGDKADRKLTVDDHRKALESAKGDVEQALQILKDNQMKSKINKEQVYEALSKIGAATNEQLYEHFDADVHDAVKHLKDAGRVRAVGKTENRDGKMVTLWKVVPAGKEEEVRDEVRAQAVQKKIDKANKVIEEYGVVGKKEKKGKVAGKRLREIAAEKKAVDPHHLVHVQYELMKLTSLIESINVEDMPLDEISVESMREVYDDLLEMWSWVDHTLSSIQSRLHEADVRAKIRHMREEAYPGPEGENARRLADVLERKLENKIEGKLYAVGG